MMHRIVLASVALLLLSLPMAAAQETQAITSQTDASRAAAALIEDTAAGVADELTKQLPRVFTEVDLSAFTDEQRAQLMEHVLRPTMSRAREAMEQHWVERPPPDLPSGILARIDQMLAQTYSGRHGEVGARRPPTSETVSTLLQARLSAAQLADVASFLESPAGRTFSNKLAAASVRRQRFDESALTQEETAALTAFAHTPGGAAYLDHAAEITSAVVEELRLNLTAHGREFFMEFAAAFCDVVGREACAAL